MTARLFIQLLLASSIFWVAICYWWWSLVRVTFLRQELFAIRNRLWDKAHALKAFNDPGYIAARTQLNACIKNAGIVSIEVIDAMLKNSDVYAAPKEDRCCTTEMQRCVNEARFEAFGTIYTYVVFHRASGWSRLVRQKSAKVARDVSRWSQGMLIITDPDSCPTPPRNRRTLKHV